MLAASSFTNPRLLNTAPKSLGYPSSSIVNPFPLPPASHRRFSHSAGRFGVKCTATKPPKSPAEEDWKVKREVLLQKRVRSVDVKEALRLQNENNFVILDVRPEAEFKESRGRKARRGTRGGLKSQRSQSKVCSRACW